MLVILILGIRLGALNWLNDLNMAWITTLVIDLNLVRSIDQTGNYYFIIKKKFVRCVTFSVMAYNTFCLRIRAEKLQKSVIETKVKYWPAKV